MGIGRLAITALLTILPCVVMAHPGHAGIVNQPLDHFLGAVAAFGILYGLIRHQWMLYKDRTDKED